MRTLIVEDNHANRQLMVKYLSCFGECDTAENGLEGVIKFQEALDSDKPYDLVCLDLMMPEMDGHDALQQIRALETAKGIRGLAGVKVLIASAADTPSGILKAFQMGCEGYLIKPIRRKEMYDTLEKLGLISASTIPQ